MAKKNLKPADVTRYTYEDLTTPIVPETGHTSYLDPDVEYVVVEMSPVQDPVLHWDGKKNHKTVPILPLQVNEVISESRIAHVVERARQRSETSETDPYQQMYLFSELEKEFRERDRGIAVEFYEHEEEWKNRLISGDSLPVMESLLHYEHMSGKVQMIYFDPPYGVNYDSNFQQRIDSTNNDNKNLADDVVTIKAYRDTWLNGVHSYLSYLQERLYLCRELLSDTGSIFVQISDENQHLVRTLLDEVFGKSNFFAQIAFVKTTGFTQKRMSSVFDYLLWYAKDISQVKYNQLYVPKTDPTRQYRFVQLPNGQFRSRTRREFERPETLPSGSRVFQLGDLSSQGAASEPQPFEFEGKVYYPSPNSHWKARWPQGIQHLADVGRIKAIGNRLRYVRYFDDFPVSPIANIWTDTGISGFGERKTYVVQTQTKVVERCLLMTTGPGDLVFDPTCGSGTTALCAEKRGRRWITCDTSRIAINVARQRLLSNAFEHYQTKNGTPASGFVYKTVSRVTLKGLSYDLEPEQVELVDQPEVIPGALRVTGPFELMTLGRYSPEDWDGYYRDGDKLRNYIEVICRLYFKDVGIENTGGFIHGVAESDQQRIAISIGPLSGRVTARQINDATLDALAMDINEVHILGWAFEPNVGEIKAKLEEQHGVCVQLVVIRPDTLAQGLAQIPADQLFAPYAQPDISVMAIENGKFVVSVNGVAVFDRKRRTTDYKPAKQNSYIASWYLDEDYDGDCFVDSQMFFNFTAVPNVSASVGRKLSKQEAKEEFSLSFSSESFQPGRYKRIAVKVVDVYGNESTAVYDLSA